MEKKTKWIVIISGVVGLMSITAMLMLFTGDEGQDDSNGIALQPAQSSGVVNVPKMKEIAPITEVVKPEIKDENTEKKVERDKPSVTEVKTVSIQKGNATANVKPATPPKPKPQGDVTKKAVKPTYKEQDVKPTQSEPKMGDANSKGEIYIAGFGWIKDCGGGEGTVVDDMKENGNKIGIMD